MKHSLLLVYMARFLHPFMLMFGVYVIMFGDSSPGGGFQGGAILASAYIASYIASGRQTFDVHNLIKLEKLLYLGIILLSLVSVFTRGEAFTNFFPKGVPLDTKRLFLLFMNIFIGFKVALGITSIFSIFVEEDG
ncbi:multisubunit sodium/proton antiporter, MrpB subunit [Peptoclostridium litorale DSM 5388]|uniref:Na+/H+ antiporter MnhB subunit-related protein domain-containing protein n=1 Tax=Peptoclostridium litorale DSM 5388 TaxID=1121324 RepID=A0A069RHD3_PEPLI|nr:MnhB domain-containing protein [Peptoclostridium litorale]KDR96183.1 hypothetical protein CLIT_4c00200 [Peptoclostridium litorale DSM 5388]SIO13114.1 multisubunit sodium/proton antiporter, MrpB subunit [Peptoclostridium litorale DSM 5388]